MKEYSREKWEGIGLLETIPEERKDRVVRVLNIVLKKLLDNETDEHKSMETISFPIFLRIVKEVDVSDEEVIKILGEIEPAVENYDFNKFGGFIHIDTEMEFVHEFSEKKLEELKNRK